MTSNVVPEYIESLILERLSYDKISGNFTWNHIVELTPQDKMYNTVNAGKEAGSIVSTGYRVITLKGFRIQAHRIAWFIVTGFWPSGDIDHINRVRSDNSFCNLREVSRLENAKNASKSKANTSGYTGVCYHKSRRKWVAFIKVEGKSKHLGTFNSPEEAYVKRLEAEKEFNFDPTHGK